MSQHYTATQAIIDFHNLPRWAGATNVLSRDVITSIKTVNDLRTSPYFLGILAPGAAIIAAGILVFFVYQIAFLCACCRCCGACKPRPKPAYHCSLRSRTTLMAIMALLNLGLILSAIAYVPGFTSGVGKVLDTSGSVANTLDTGYSVLTSSSSVTYTLGGTTRTVKTSVASDMVGAYSDAKSARIKACSLPVIPYGTDLCSTFTDIENNMMSLNSTVLAGASPLSASASSLRSATSAIPFDNYKSQINMGGIIVLAVISGIIAIHSILLCPNRCVGLMFKGFSFISVTLSALVFILAGIFFIVSVPGSDFCYSPYTVSASLVGDSDPTGTLVYYLTCYSTGASIPLTSAPGLILSGSSDLFIASSNITAQLKTPEYTAAVAILGPDFNASAYSLVGHLVNAGFTMKDFLSSVISCSYIDSLMSGVFEGLCGGGIASSVGVTRILIAAACLLILQLSLGVDLTCYHPGDPNAWTEKGNLQRSGLSLRDHSSINGPPSPYLPRPPVNYGYA